MAAGKSRRQRNGRILTLLHIMVAYSSLPTASHESPYFFYEYMSKAAKSRFNHRNNRPVKTGSTRKEVDYNAIQALLDKGMTQREIAKSFGISQSKVSFIKNRKGAWQ